MGRNHALGLIGCRIWIGPFVMGQNVQFPPFG